MKTYKNLLAIAATVATASLSAEGIPTQGGAIRCAAVAQIDGAEMIYISEENGAVSLNGIDGEQLWRIESANPAVVFEIEAVDLDGDKSEDLLAVSGNGSLMAYSSKGELMWRFETDEISRLSEVATIGKGADLRIFTGGNNYKLYELNAAGELFSTTKIAGCVRSLESGCFVDAKREVLYLHTYSHDKYNSKFFGFIDPQSKATIKELDIRKILGNGEMVNDVDVADVDGDGRDDVLLFSSAKTGTLTAVNGELTKIFQFKGSKDTQRYAAAKGVSLLPERDEIVMQFGGVLYVISSEGKQIARSGKAHEGIIYNDLVWLGVEGKVAAMGQTGGDNSIYLYDTSAKNWASTTHSLSGLALEVEQNINDLYAQSLKFKMPKYQTKSEKPFVVLGLKDEELAPKVAKLNGGEIVMVSTSAEFSENTPRTEMIAAIGDSAAKRDKRKKYNNTPEEIVAWAAEQEAAGKPFQLWVGHGTDPFYIHISTLEKIIAAAPTCCYGFIYAEMNDSVDPAVQYFVDEYMPRLAAAIRKHDAATKIYFRYKNMFWAADAHEPTWQKVFFSGEYSDIVVPSAEDTNNRLQDLNLTGRVGMFMSGYIDNFAMRLVDDNPTSWRPLSQGGQRSVSPYLRTAVLTSAYGSSHGVLFSIKYLEEPRYNAFFALVKSGVLPMVEPEDILSVSSWHLVKDLDEDYLRKVNDTGHNLMTCTPDDDKAVVGKAGVPWCGASTTPYDYSRVSLGVEYRWLNFIPPMPNGMVPITSAAALPALKQSGAEYVVSDIKSGYVEGAKVDAESFGKTMAQSVEAGASKMLMRVDGASWALLRVGERQARLILIDNGYVSPGKKSAKVKLQNLVPARATDILSGEKISLSGNEIEIEVPAGSVRFIDFEYNSKI